LYVAGSAPDQEGNDVRFMGGEHSSRASKATVKPDLPHEHALTGSSGPRQVHMKKDDAFTELNSPQNILKNSQSLHSPGLLLCSHSSIQFRKPWFPEVWNCSLIC